MFQVHYSALLLFKHGWYYKYFRMLPPCVGFTPGYTHGSLGQVCYPSTFARILFCLSQLLTVTTDDSQLFNLAISHSHFAFIPESLLVIGGFSGKSGWKAFLHQACHLVWHAPLNRTGAQQSQYDYKKNSRLCLTNSTSHCHLMSWQLAWTTGQGEYRSYERSYVPSQI